MSGYIIGGSVLVLLVAITGCLLAGRGANLIAGFNTLSKDEKERFDKPALCKFVGKILIPIDIAFITLFIGAVISAPWSTVVGIVIGVLTLPYIIAITVYANTGNRFRY
jgi:hypothetical protein